MFGWLYRRIRDWLRGGFERVKAEGRTPSTVTLSFQFSPGQERLQYTLPVVSQRIVNDPEGIQLLRQEDGEDPDCVHTFSGLPEPNGFYLCTCGNHLISIHVDDEWDNYVVMDIPQELSEKLQEHFATAPVNDEKNPRLVWLRNEAVPAA